MIPGFSQMVMSDMRDLASLSSYEYRLCSGMLIMGS